MSTEEQEWIDRFEKLCSELTDLDDEALKARFQELCHQMTEPVVELARTHIVPPIEWSVLLCMSIDSVATYVVVENVPNAGLLDKGAGYIVLRLSGCDETDTWAAAAVIADDLAVMAKLFEEK